MQFLSLTEEEPLPLQSSTSFIHLLDVLFFSEIAYFISLTKISPCIFFYLSLYYLSHNLEILFIFYLLHLHCRRVFLEVGGWILNSPENITICLVPC